MMQDSVTEYTCPICLHIATDAVESLCCANLFCHACCTSLSACPLCCHSTFSYQASLFMRRKILDLDASCPHGCTVKLKRRSLEQHSRTCPKRVLQCESTACTYTGPASELARHIAEVHINELLSNMKLLFCKMPTAENLRLQAESAAVCPNGRELNSLGRWTRLGLTGKSYCEGRLAFSCGCCDGYCGPTNGCNCVPCMKLDIQRRRLPKGFLVNKAGFCAARREDKFYCGRRVMLGYRNCDGYCGPNNGPNCESCQVLDRTYQFYGSLL